MQIFANFKGHGWALILAVLLLLGQAVCDLALPNFTSQIVDVGIQQAGVEHAAVDEMSASSFDEVCAMLSDDEAAVVRDSYRFDESSGTYRLTEQGASRKDELDSLLAFPLAAIHDDPQREGSWRTMIDRYEQGEASRKDLIEAEKAARSSAEGDLVSQKAIAAARSEYASLGYNLTDMQMGYLVRTGLLMLGVTACGMAFAIAVGFVASRTGAKIGRDLRNRLFSQVVSFNEQEIGSFSAASLITRGTNDIQLVQNVSTMLMRMVLYAPILAVGGIVMVMVTDASLGWIVVVAILCAFVLIAIVFKVANPKFRIMQQLIDRVNLVAREMLTGLSVVRAFDREDFEEKRFDKANEELMGTQLFTNRVMTFMMPVMMLIMNATSVAIVWFGGGFVDSGSIQTGDLIAFITYAMVIIMGFNMMAMISIMLPRANVAAKRVREVIETRPAVEDPAHPVSVRDRTEQRGVSIVFDDVSFAYPESDECVLRHVSFEAKPGQVLAVVGSTGSGKSTIIKLIERFYDATEGTVRVDGEDVRTMDQKDLRALFGYVPQKGFLFSGTVASNVAYGEESLDDARMEQALYLADALDFVNAEEDGADTLIAQGGTNVSGGQRQRLAIARAVARQAPGYLFDDCFSALDYRTDAAVRMRLAEGLDGATQIIVAQRIATVRHADAIVVLEEGRVTGIGTHDQLLESCEAYRDIALSQLSEAELGQGGGAL